MLGQSERSQDQRITHSICSCCAEAMLLEAVFSASDMPGWIELGAASEAARIVPSGAPDRLQKIA